MVITGGEPMLQLDAGAASTRCTHAASAIAVETNGTLPAVAGHRLDLRQPQGGDATWFSGGGTNSSWCGRRRGSIRPSSKAGSSIISSSSRWTANAREEALEAAIELAMDRPKWRLSLQAHKVVGLA